MAEADAYVAFLDHDAATSSELAEDLRNALVDDVPSLEIDRERDDPRKQDFGATLAIILGSAAVTALARGIGKWLARRSEAHLVLRRTLASGEIKELDLKGQVGRRAADAIEAFFD